MEKTKRICLWSGPRNISTTMMYSFAQRADTKVFDEPLYAYYLSQTSASDYHPGADDILASMETNGDKVIEQMMSCNEKTILFFKNMTHHLLKLNRAFLKDVVNVILTRNPKEMIPSFDKVVANPSLDDVGYAQQTELVEYLLKNNINVIVLDSKEILIDPEKSLIELCTFADIPFDPSMLHWDSGARPEDGIWAKYWYSNVHISTGFLKYKPKTEPFPKRLEPLLHECQPYYDFLMSI